MEREIVTAHKEIADLVDAEQYCGSFKSMLEEMNFETDEHQDLRVYRDAGGTVVQHISLIVPQRNNHYIHSNNFIIQSALEEEALALVSAIKGYSEDLGYATHWPQD